MRSLKALFFAASLALVGLFSAPALADSVAIGPVLGVHKLQSGSDAYTTYTGYVTFGAGVRYWFGGSRCTGITAPSDTTLMILHDRMVAGKSVTIHYKTVGAYNCMVGYLAE